MQQAASVPAPGEAAGDPLALGRSVRFTKTAGESDVYLFAGVSGDLGPNHVDEEYMRKARCGRRIAHGVLLIGYMSTCSTKLIESAGNEPTVSDDAYDHVRFVRPVFIGDTVTGDVHGDRMRRPERRDPVRRGSPQPERRCCHRRHAHPAAGLIMTATRIGAEYGEEHNLLSCARTPRPASGRRSRPGCAVAGPAARAGRSSPGCWPRSAR